MTLRQRSILCMLLCATLWSLGGIFIKLIPWHPLVIAGFRSLIAASVFVVFLIKKRIAFHVSRKSLSVAAAMSLTFFSFVIANKLTTAANAIILQYCAPVFILIYNAAVLRQRLRGADVLVVLLTLIGISLFFIGELDGGSLIGNIVAIMAGVFFAAMFLTTSAASEAERMNGMLQGQLLTALIGIPMALFFDTPVTSVSVLSILALGVFQLGIPYVLYALAARGCPPFMCSLLSALEPLFNPVWVALFIGETPGAFALVGGVLVVGSITLWCVWDQKQYASAAADEGQ